jgi:hypothetical protein
VNLKATGLMTVASVSLFVLTACGLMSSLPVSGISALAGASGQQAMWTDVPAFEGATQDAKEALGTSLFNQAQATEKSKMETMLFRTAKSPQDVAAFYTGDRMKQLGWAPMGLGSSSNGCTQDHFEGQARTICEFGKKNEEGRSIDLTIDARVDPTTNNTRLVFVRTVGSLVTP